jgi:hypothetical protein
VLGTTIVWIVVTMLTRPVERETLHTFFRKTHPGGIGWRPVSRELPDVQGDTGFGRLFLDWLCGVIVVYSALFGIGKIIFAEFLSGILILALGAAAGAFIYVDLQKRGWEQLSE